MLREFKNLTNLLLTEKKYVDLRRKIGIIVLVFLALIVIDRFVLTNLANKNAYYVSLTRTRMVFQGNLSAYETDINPSSEIIKSIGITLGEIEKFKLPLYALIFYLPFSYIKDFEWSLALWLATNQIICYFILSSFLRILNWKIKDLYQIAGAVVLFSVYFVFGNILETNLSLIQLLLIVVAIGRLVENEYIFSGILLGFASAEPYLLFLPLLVIFLLNFRKGRGTINLWIIISICLLAMTMFIFDMRWMLELLKVLLLQSSSYPFISFHKYFANVFPSMNSVALETIPIIVFIWLAIEWLRTPAENIFQEFWLISLAFTLNPLLNMWSNSYATVGYLFAFLYTLSLWFERSTQKFRIFSGILYLVIMIVLPAARLIVNQQLLSPANMIGYNLIVSLILIFNLYWVRLWVMNPYYSVNKLDEY